MDYLTKDNREFFYPDVEVDKIKNILFDDLFYDKELETHFFCIEQIMINNGAVFFSPGGSFKRRILLLLTVLMNSKQRKLGGKNSYKILRSKDIRVHIDTIAEKILEKLNLVN